MKINSNYFKRRYTYGNKKKNYTLIVLFLTLFFTVGYAYLNTLLSINGIVKVNKNTWDVHFENIQKVDGSVDATVDATISNNTTVDFTVDLQMPGEFYSFTVDVVNNGTIDAMLSEILKTGLTTEQEVYTEYTVTYNDGEEILEKDSLPSGMNDTLLITVKYKDGITAEQLPTEDQSINLSLEADYIQDDGTSDSRRPPIFLYDKMIIQNQENGQMVLDNESSTYVSANTGINFSVSSSDTNGRGLYVRAGTENDSYPIYYYRGNVTNNNVVFGDHCWKMVRTTETGGVKLIYNGVYNHYEYRSLEADEYINVENLTSNPFTFDSSTKQWVNSLDKKQSSNMKLSIAIEGDYILDYDLSLCDGDYVYVYSDNLKVGDYFDIVDSGSIPLGNLNSTNILSVYYDRDDFACSEPPFVKFSLRRKTDEVISTTCDNIGEDTTIGKMNFGDTTNSFNGFIDSNMKKFIDKWYKDNLISYNNCLEDTIWCEDKTIMDNGEYAALKRLSDDNPMPTFECTNQNDRFTVSKEMLGRVNGNGNLTYPIALLTADEVMFAGVSYDDNNTDNIYLDNEDDYNWWWTMTPRTKYLSFIYGSSLSFGALSVGFESVRPSVSLKNDTIISKVGDGSVNNPFVVLSNN